MKVSRLRSAVVGLCAVLILLAYSSCLVAETWVWKADNHKLETITTIERGMEVERKVPVSYFDDGRNTFTMFAEGGAVWVWDDPALGMVSYRSLMAWMGHGPVARGVARSSDFGDALDIRKGITVAARVKPIYSHSHGTLMLSVDNESSSGLPDGSTHVWVGWTMPDEIRFYSRNGTCLDSVRAAQSDDDLLDMITKGTAAAWSKIENGKGKVTVYSSYKNYDKNNEQYVLEDEREYQVVFQGARFKIEGDKYLGKYTPPSGETIEDSYPAEVMGYDGNRITRFWPTEKRASVGDVDTPAGRDALSTFRIEISMLGKGLNPLIGPYAPENLNLPRPRLPTTFGDFRIVGRELLNGEECIVIERDIVIEWPAGPRDRRVKYWVCPSQGFAVLRVQLWSQGRSGHGDELKLVAETNFEMRQYASEVWGPAKVDWVQYAFMPTGAYEIQQHRIITYAPDFRLNVPLTDADLALALPSGTEVHDEILDARYTVP